MTTQHKALLLAVELRNYSESEHYMNAEGLTAEAANTIIDLHALIVQMRGELADLKARMQPNVNGADETYFFIGLKQQISMSRMGQLSECLAAADKYLGEQG